MGRLTFKGGIHPYDGKELSKDKPIKDMPAGELMYYPLGQHIGAPAEPVVAKGDKVLEGQMIAKASGFMSSPIYSSVSGTVLGMEKRLTVVGAMADCIVIQNDFEYTQAPPITDKKFEEMSRQEIIDTIGLAGIVGMGGAGFPTHVKLSPKEPENIQYVIVNCAECEPYLTSDYRKMLEEPDKLIKGLMIEVSLFPGATGVLAIEDNKPDCIKLLTDLTKDLPNICVRALKTKYPQGSERHLIYAVTKRKLNSKMLPSDVGCIVNNVDTVIAINNAVMEGKPLYERIITVTGDAVKKPCNYRVRTGTLYSHIVENCGGLKGNPEKIISGGPMMGFSLYDLEVPVTKSSSALLCMKKDEVKAARQTACINCGRCANACPSGLLPGWLEDAANHGDSETFLKLGGLECVECGSCSYVCPAKKQLCQSIKSMRKVELANMKKKK